MTRTRLPLWRRIPLASAPLDGYNTCRCVRRSSSTPGRRIGRRSSSFCPLCSRQPSVAHGCRSWWILALSISPWRGRRDAPMSSCGASRRSRRVASPSGYQTGGRNGPGRKYR
jgi:hypothetical protein